jgi:hypothetical protein
MSTPVAPTPAGLDFARFGNIFGSADQAPSTGASAPKKAQAQIWLNFGYNRPVTGANGETSTVFVSLPFGIPVDTQDMKDLKGSSNMLQLRKWQNELLEEVVRIGEALEPGDEKILSYDATNGLAIQIRRVRAEVSADQVDSGERFTLRCHGEQVAENA